MCGWLHLPLTFIAAVIAKWSLNGLLSPIAPRPIPLETVLINTDFNKMCGCPVDGWWVVPSEQGLKDWTSVLKSNWLMGDVSSLVTGESIPLSSTVPSSSIPKYML